MTEPDDVGATLPQARLEGKSFGVVGKRYKPGFPVAIVAHQDGELATGFEGIGTVAKELAIPAKEVFERGAA